MGFVAFASAGLVWAKPLIVLAPIAAFLGLSQPQTPPGFEPPPPPRPTAEKPQALRLAVQPAPTSAQRILEARVTQLGRSFDGLVGIAVRDVETGWTTSWNGERLFPQQSVSKFWVALAALDRVDRGDLDMSSNVTIRREDLTLFHQPIRELVNRNGSYTTTLDNLLFRAITQSDNTANDVVLRNAGGPEAVRALLARHGLEDVRFGPGERLLQSQIAGVDWNSSYSLGNAFYAARRAVPASTRRANFDNYVADPMDGASPLALVDGLARLQRGELLSPQSTRRLLSVMSQTRTGRQRLTGGLAPGWSIAHKTGTGQEFNGAQAGYNDIGILTSPDGRHYAVAVMIGRTSAPVPQRMRLMQEVTRATIAYHEQR